MRVFFATLLGLSLPFFSLIASPKSDASQRLSVMFYNVYNLFDAQHDDGKNDWEFLPKDFPGKEEQCERISNPRYRQQCLDSDWTSAKVELKLNQLKSAILTAAPKKPHILGLCEVENEHIVGKLAAKLGYQRYLVSNSPDHRGIDVALLFNTNTDLRFTGNVIEHTIRADAIERPTRNILEAEFALNGERLFFFVNHWPSQGAPSPARNAAARLLREIINQRLAQDETHVIVMGDFNVIDRDHPHPFRDVLNGTDIASMRRLLDVHDLFKADHTIPDEIKKATPIGTYFYVPDMAWNRLDRFFISQSLQDRQGIELRPHSYRIVSKPFITSKFHYNHSDYHNYGSVVAGIPFRGRTDTLSPTKAGFSDHFPIYVELRY